MKVIIIGGGWAGVAAAITAKKSGADVELFERTDLLLGLGNVGGIMRNNGRFTATEELIAMGASELFEITDRCSRHVNINFPGHKHASLYDVNIIEAEVRELLVKMNVVVHLNSRVIDVIKYNNSIKNIVLSDSSYYDADVFIEATGSTGPMGNCLRYGNGCSMCILRCPSFGPRVSISSRAGIPDLQGERDFDSYGAFSGSCKLAKESLSKEILDELNTAGVVVIKIPEEDINLDKLKTKVCQQYALKEFAENLILLDTGHAKLMTTYYPLDKLRKIKGLERARYIDPYSGGKGNSIRYLSVAPRDNTMKVNGIVNLFCAGEKAGLFVGHTEAIATGSLAGLNAIRFVKKQSLVELPNSLVTGDIISYANEKIHTTEGRRNRYTFAGSEFFTRMIDRGLYSTDVSTIKDRVEGLRFTGCFN